MNNLRDYMAVTAAYWGFTLTDGALRMLVLLHFHQLGFSPLDLAIMFLLYEAMGVITNFMGGWIGARFGLRLTLVSGLTVQIAALLMLSMNDPAWALSLSIAYVMAAQALSGVAKDLTKMSSKSAVKLVVAAEDQRGLFKWVAILTGSKNALKGAGFLLGGILLASIGFEWALWAMAGGLSFVLLATLVWVRADLGQAKSKVTRRDLFSKSRAINLLSAARVFLFASRDVWFVVGLPIFLYDQLGWRFDQVGAFMAAWIVGYGVIQASAPRLLGPGAADRATGLAKVWGAVLVLVPAGIAFALSSEAVAAVGVAVTPGVQSWILIVGLMAFGAVFAMNSSIHSFLIVSYSDADKIALNVGFYYMANAVGRFAGTFLSGLVYQLSGLTGALLASTAMLAVAVAVTAMLDGSGAGSSAGSSKAGSSTESEGL